MGCAEAESRREDRRYKTDRPLRPYMNRAVALGAVAGVLAVLALVSVPQAALAHPGHGHRGVAVPLVPSVTFLVGVTVLVGSLLGDHSGLLERRLADVGLVVGVLVGLTGLTWFWI